MKSLTQIIALFLFSMAIFTASGQSAYNKALISIKMFDLDAAEYECTPFTVSLTLIFKSDSVKGIQTEGGDGCDRCFQPSGCFLGKIQSNKITGTFYPDRYTDELTKPLPFSMKLNGSSLKESKGTGVEYPFIKSERNEFAMYSMTNINLRESPSVNSKVLAKVPEGQSLEIIEFGFYGVIGENKGFWTNVKFGNQVGWVFSSYLSEISSTQLEEMQ